jgi:glycosyltransferase involved in cell wall biosynthesis
MRRHSVVMLTTSYPRFPGDTIGTFMEPIAKGVAARGHDVHVVLPWHPRLARRPVEDGVHFHPFRYAPHPDLNVFGYAAALQADVQLRHAAYLAAPFAITAAWLAVRRVAAEAHATMLHGHWIIPGGVITAFSGLGLPLVVSLHGSDVFVAERHAFARSAAQSALRRLDWLTACSDDLRDRMIAIGADPARAETIPYGVDAERFKPDAALRTEGRRLMGARPDDLVLFTAGRFVRKKGFEYLVDAVGRLAPTWPSLRLVIGGGGDLDDELRARARERGVADRVRFPGVLAQDEVARCLAGADLAVMPSVHDDAGNVDGLPNTVMEALASGTALVATRVGGIPAVIEHERTGWLVAERDAAALAVAIEGLLARPEARAAIGSAAREDVLRRRTWASVAEAFEQVYDRAAVRAEGRRRTD